MHKQKKFNNNKCNYFRHSFRIGDKVKKVRFYIPQNKNVNEFLNKNNNIIDKISSHIVEHIKKF